MSDNKHTPEPWSVWGRTVAGPRGLLIEDSKGESIALVWEGGCGDEADARRIVACVNACAGIKTEDLEAMRETSILAKANAWVDGIAKQRDELLASLEDAMDWFKNLDDWTGVGDPNLKMYSDAIASVKGINPVVKESLTTETAAPAIVFYPAGSLGEEVQS